MKYNNHYCIHYTYIANNRPSKYIKKKLTKLKGEIDSSITIVKTSVPHTHKNINRTTKKKVRK